MTVVTETAAAEGKRGAAADNRGETATLLAGISSVLKMTTHVIDNGVATLSSVDKDSDSMDSEKKSTKRKYGLRESLILD